MAFIRITTCIYFLLFATQYILDTSRLALQNNLALGACNS